MSELLFYSDQVMKQEQYQDLLRAAEHHRLIKALNQPEPEPPQNTDTMRRRVLLDWRIPSFGLILIGLALIALFFVGGLTPTGSVGPQAGVGPDVTGVGRIVGSELIFGIDWVYVVASLLVLVALVVGLAIGSGSRRQALQR